MHNPYALGFLEKCAERGIDPNMLRKFAGMDEDVGEATKPSYKGNAGAVKVMKGTGAGEIAAGTAKSQSTASTPAAKPVGVQPPTSRWDTKGWANYIADVPQSERPARRDQAWASVHPGLNRYSSSSYRR